VESVLSNPEFSCRNSKSGEPICKPRFNYITFERQAVQRNTQRPLLISSYKRQKLNCLSPKLRSNELYYEMLHQLKLTSLLTKMSEQPTSTNTLLSLSPKCPSFYHKTPKYYPILRGAYKPKRQLDNSLKSHW